MAKSKTFKRIAALATAIALVVCFAVSASAAVPQVTTKTAYVAGDTSKVNVTVDVTDADGAEYVTYYATKDGVVYVDQVAVDGEGNAQIKYQTVATNLKGTVKVGYTGAGSAIPDVINARTVTCDSKAVAYIPTEEDSAAFEFEYSPAANQTVDTVTAEGAVVSGYEYISAEGKISVTLASITGDVTLTVTQKATAVYDADITVIDAAAIVVADELGEDAANTAKKGDRKITIIGKALNADEYGVVVSTSALTTGTVDKAALEAAGADFYKALGNVVEEGSNRNGLFAVQIIDEGADGEGATIQSGIDYHVAVYAYDAGEYRIVASDAINTDN